MIITRNILFLVFSFWATLLFSQSKTSYEIYWVDNFKEDFSFRKNWSYNENVFKNEIGQLVCDGYCPENLNGMRDSKGHIYPDSISKYYELFDTTHFYHSLLCESTCSEFAGSDYIFVKKGSADTLFCRTAGTVSTHCSLSLTITKTHVFPMAELNSIMMDKGLQYYEPKRGVMEIDKIAWENGVLKALFEFEFHDPENPKTPIEWRGKIYSLIY